MISTDDKYPIRDIFRTFYPEFLRIHPCLSLEKQKVANAIMQCKTGELGYDISVCEDCGCIRIHAVSCNNRSCPCCQHPLERKWEAARNTEIIRDIAYYHVVFTLPHELCMLIKLNMQLLLDLLIRCAQDTILSLSESPKYMGAKPGIITVLHTWGQKLSFHPHVHMCISGGGLTPDNRFKETGHKGFFIPQTVLASSFRGRYLCGLKKLYDSGKLILSHEALRHLDDPHEWMCFIDRLFEKQWMPFIKETFNGRGNAVKYLARYSFRTAIANSRIISFDDETVTFSYMDYADHNRVKQMRVRGVDFIGMFLQHVLPKGFNRTRFSGYLTNCSKNKNLKLIHILMGSVYEGNPYPSMKMAEVMSTLYGVNICVCHQCSGHLIHLGRDRPGAWSSPHLYPSSAMA